MQGCHFLLLATHLTCNICHEGGNELLPIFLLLQKQGIMLVQVIQAGLGLRHLLFELMEFFFLILPKWVILLLMLSDLFAHKSPLSQGFADAPLPSLSSLDPRHGESRQKILRFGWNPHTWCNRPPAASPAPLTPCQAPLWTIQRDP